MNFLNQKYEVESLKNQTEEYISNHRSEIALQFLYVHQNDSKISTVFYQEVISSHLEEFIKDKEILNLRVPILLRILVRYSKKKKYNNSDDNVDEKTFSNEILHFLLNFVDKYEREASALFENQIWKIFNSLKNKILNIFMKIRKN